MGTPGQTVTSNPSIIRKIAKLIFCQILSEQCFVSDGFVAAICKQRACLAPAYHRIITQHSPRSHSRSSTLTRPGNEHDNSTIHCRLIPIWHRLLAHALAWLRTMERTVLATINSPKLRTPPADELGIICRQVSTLTRGKLKEVLATNCAGVFFTFSPAILLRCRACWWQELEVHSAQWSGRTRVHQIECSMTGYCAGTPSD